MSDIVRLLVARFEVAEFSERVATLKLLSEAAYYIPRDVLPLVRQVVDECVSDPVAGFAVATASECLRKIAFSYDLLSEALRLLWQLRLSEESKMPVKDSKPHKVITDLATFEPDKPPQYALASMNAMILAVNFGEETGSETAFEVIDGVLAKAGTQTYCANHRFVSHSFAINRAQITEARDLAIDQLFSGLHSAGLRQQLRCVKSVSDVLRKPHAPMGLSLTEAQRNQWIPEQIAIFQRLKAYLPTAEPLVVTQIVEAIGWHVLYESRPQLVTVARDVARAVVDSFELRFLRCLVRNANGDWACNFVDAPVPVDHKKVVEERGELQVRFVGEVVEELSKRFSAEADIVTFVRDALSDCERGAVDVNLRAFFHQLVRLNADFAWAIADSLVSNPPNLAIPDIRWLLEPLACLDRQRGVEHLRRMTPGLPAMQIEAAKSLSYSDWFSHRTDDCVEVLRDLVRRASAETIEEIATAICRLWDKDQTEAIRLAITLEVPSERHLADKYAAIFDKNHGIPVSRLSPEQFELVLGKLSRLPSVDGWHITQLLKQVAELDQTKVLDFFLDRIEKSQTAPSGYDAIPSSFGSSPFADIVNYETCQEATRLIAKRAVGAEYYIQYELGELLRLLSDDHRTGAVAVLREFIESGDIEKHAAAIELAAKLGSEFITDHSEFVCAAFQAAEKLGEEALSLTDRRFYFTTVNRVRMGSAGEPFPEDVRLYEACQIVLARTDLCESARRFYEHIMLLASKDITAGAADDEYEL